MNLERPYPDLVRDLLTLLTQGTVAEVHEVPEGGLARMSLRNAPVRRISHLEGELQVGEERKPYRFTERDFELVGTEDNPHDLVAIRFTNRRRQPAPGSRLTVNYYPLRTKATPLTDLSVGSVVRTLLETAAREMATQYLQLQRVYESAFVESAKGGNLDKVVALLDVQRLRRGHPVGKVRFTRRPGSPGTVTIPAETAVTDGGKARYLTSQEATLLPNQGAVEVWVHGEARETGLVDAGGLNVLERAIAGVDRVTNDEPSFTARDEEDDEQLASRARRAVHATGKGTLDAIRFGLESLPFVSGVSLAEWDGTDTGPVPRPGMLRVDVALSEDNPFRRSQVDQVIDRLRPAGIYIARAWATGITLGFQAGLRLAGASLPTSVVREIEDGVSTRLSEYAAGLSPGGTVRRARVLSLILSDDRIVDATLTITRDGAAESGDSFTLEAGKVARPADPPVTFLPPTYDETGPTGIALVFVDLDLALSIARQPTTELESDIRTRLQTLLDTAVPGNPIAFSAVLSTIREPGNDPTTARFVAGAQETLLAFEREDGSFQEVRNGESWPMPAGISLVLRRVDLHQPGGAG